MDLSLCFEKLDIIKNEGLSSVSTRLYLGLNKKHSFVLDGKPNELAKPKGFLRISGDKLLLTEEVLDLVYKN